MKHETRVFHTLFEIIHPILYVPKSKLCQIVPSVKPWNKSQNLGLRRGAAEPYQD